MPGPTQNDARLAQSKTDTGMLESSRAAIEEFGSIWDPLSDDTKVSQAQKDKKTKDIVGPNNVDPVQAGYVNDHWFPEEGDPQFSYKAIGAAQKDSKKDKKDVVAEPNKDTYQRDFVNSNWYPEEGDPQHSYTFKQKKNMDVVGPNNKDPVQSGYVNDHWFPEEGDPQFSYTIGAAQKDSKDGKKDVVAEPNKDSYQRDLVNSNWYPEEGDPQHSYSFQQKTDKKCAKGKDVLGDDCVPDW